MVCANFVCSNYVQKESSIRTKLHVIRDLSGAFLFNAIQWFPGQDLEGICRQLVIFKSFVDNFISTIGQNCLIASNIATKLQEAFLKYHIYLLERVQAGEKGGGH